MTQFTLPSAKHGIALHRFPAEAAVRSAPNRPTKENSHVMTNIAHPVLVIVTIGLSLTLLLFCAHVINFLAQKTNVVKRMKRNYRVIMSSVFEQAAITCTMTGLYAALMTLFFMVIGWGSPH